MDTDQEMLWVNSSTLGKLDIEENAETGHTAEVIITAELGEEASKVGWINEDVRLKAFVLIKEGFGLNI